MFLFNLNVVFTTNFLKMAPIRVRFSPGFPPGAGFHGICSSMLLAPRWSRKERRLFHCGCSSVFAGAGFHREECSGVLLAPRREDNFTGRKQVLCLQLAWSADPTWRIF
jgi:hypothetical protein